jgi:hypothetical protein
MIYKYNQTKFYEEVDFEQVLEQHEERLAEESDQVF